MRAYELYESSNPDYSSPGWLNTKTGKEATLMVDMSHSADVLLHPENYGFTKQDLLDAPFSEELTDAIETGLDLDDYEFLSEVDANADILKFMSDHNWVRYVLDKNNKGIVTSAVLQAYDLKEAHRATQILTDKYPGIESMFITIQQDKYSGKYHSLKGKGIDLFTKHGRIPSASVMEDKDLDRPVTQEELNSLENKLDHMYASLGLDIEFTKHFLDRVNDPRNQTQITINELFKLFQEELKVHGKKIAQAGPDFEAVMNDISTSLNVPFILKWNRDTEMLEVVSKTIMRKDNFMSSTPKLTVGLTSKKKKG